MIVPPLCIIFWTTALLQSVLRIFQDLVEEVRSGKTPIAPESMGNTDAVFTMDVILKLLENRAVNSLTPEKTSAATFTQ